MRDLHNSIDARMALTNQDISSNTTTTGEIIDVANRESCEFIITSGSIADGNFELVIRHGDDSGLSDVADVDDSMLVGTEVGAIFTDAADSDEVHKIGYIGDKRYVRMQFVSTSVSGANDFSAICVLSHARKGPRSTQVA